MIVLGQFFSEIYGKEQIKVFLAFCQGVSTIHHCTTVAKIKKAMGHFVASRGVAAYLLRFIEVFRLNVNQKATPAILCKSLIFMKYSY